MAARQEGSFKGRHFTSEVILWALRWYLAFPVSYRDLASMLTDRGVMVDHSTLFRWVRPMRIPWNSGSGVICAHVPAHGG